MYPVVSHRSEVGSKPSISASVPITRLPPGFGVPTVPALPTDVDPVPVDVDVLLPPPPPQAATTTAADRATATTRVLTRILSPPGSCNSAPTVSAAATWGAMTVIDALRSCDLFRHFDRKELEELARIAEEVH